MINEKFFAHEALLQILDGLLEIHDDIPKVAEKMRILRTDRRRKENWNKPHIKGPRRGWRR